MQAIWYGDRRDRVKWGGLIYLAERNDVSCIVQVAFYRESPHPVLKSNDSNFPIPDAVWKHFSDLRNIQRLAQASGRNIKVIDRPFSPDSRRDYIAGVVAELELIRSPKIVFLDPDTGLAPESPKPKHVTEDDLREVWDALETNDILVVYQHATRSRDWLEKSRVKLSKACGEATVQPITSNEIAKDVALLWCTKGRP